MDIIMQEVIHFRTNFLIVLDTERSSVIAIWATLTHEDLLRQDLLVSLEPLRLELVWWAELRI